MIRKRLTVSLLTTLITATLGSNPGLAAEVYVWTDGDGKKHFTDKPPPGTIKTEQKKFEIDNIDEGYPYTDPNQYQYLSETTAEKRQREKTEAAVADRRLQETMVPTCKKAKARLTALEGRVAFFDDDGNEIRISETEKQRQAAELREDISSFCS